MANDESLCWGFGYGSNMDSDHLAKSKNVTVLGKKDTTFVSFIDPFLNKSEWGYKRIFTVTSNEGRNFILEIETFAKNKRV